MSQPDDVTRSRVRKVECSYCHGEGVETGSVTPYGTQTFECPECEGDGWLLTDDPIPDTDCTCGLEPAGESSTCPLHATPDRVPIYPAYLRAVQLCQFDGCDEPAVGAYYVSVRGGSQLYVCQEHGDAISQTSHWHSVRPEDWDAV